MKQNLTCLLCGFETDGPTISNHVKKMHSEHGGFEKYLSYFGGIVPVVSEELYNAIENEVKYGFAADVDGMDKLTLAQKKLLVRIVDRSRTQYRTEIKEVNDF